MTPMFDHTDGWRARVIDQLGMHQRLVMGRPNTYGEPVDMVVGVEETGHLRIERTTDAVAASVDFGLWLPHGLVVAIGEAIKPGPGSGEVKRLEEALAVERARVDRLLERAR